MATSDKSATPESPLRRHLFVEGLLIEPVEAPARKIEVRYDEDRALTVTDSGDPFVETAAVGETTTLTEVRGEHDDKDEEPTTFTFVQSEGADWSAAGDSGSDGGVPPPPWAGTVTVTKATGETDDADELAQRSLGGIGTKTSVRGESEDLEAWSSTVTGTRVAVEQGDQD